MMSIENIETGQKSLGTLLRESREMHGYAQEKLAHETKISLPCLNAMECDDFPKLPSRTFARGFYRLYAQAVGLDSAEILQKFDQQFSELSYSSHGALPPTVRAQKLENMAERPIAGSLFSWVLIGLILLLLATGLLSWYFSWNPASYLSDKLRSFDTGSSTDLMLESQVLHSDNNDSAAPQNKTTSWPLFSTATFAQSAYATSTPRDTKPNHAVNTSGYSISAIFHSTTRLNLSVDGAHPSPHTYVKGESAQWLAERKIILTLPEDADLSLTMNDRPVPFPSSQNGLITIILPDDLL